MMGIKMRLALTTVVLIVSILAVASGQSTSCVNEFLRICNDANTTIGLQSCCAILTQYYRTDRPCLCLIAGSAKFSDEKLIQLLNGCGEIIAAGTPVCSAAFKSPPPPPDLYPPPSDISPPSSYYYTSPPHRVSTPSSVRPPPRPNKRSSFNKNGDDSQSKSQLSKGAFVGIIVGALGFVCLLVLLLVFLLRKRNYPPQAAQQGQGEFQVPVPMQPRVYEQQQQQQGNPTTIIASSCTIFTYEELMKASDGFAKHNLLGCGGFGDVHRGRLPNGDEVAIKKMNAESLIGTDDFENQVQIISRVHHNNVVSFLGYCSSNSEKLLVFELVPNGTLESHLHEGKSGYTMNWSKRMKVALGSAKGLAYLHEDCHPRIVHRDIKAANILLDDDFVAKVADFDFAKKVDKATCATTRIVGTLGYLAPEYALGDKPTDKSDVYSFGVILLELITGRRPLTITEESNNKSLVHWARPLLYEALMSGNCDVIVDERLRNNCNDKEMLCVIGCSAACIRHSPDDRPSMSRVVRILEGLVSIDELKEGLQPNERSANSSTNFDGPRVRSGNYTSGSYSATNGEYDQNRFSYATRTGR